MKKVVGQVSELEKREIQILFERRNGLNELAKILTADNTELYERLIKDLGETSIKFQKWWNQMSVFYNNINNKLMSLWNSDNYLYVSMMNNQSDYSNQSKYEDICVQFQDVSKDILNKAIIRKH